MNSNVTAEMLQALNESLRVAAVLKEAAEPNRPQKPFTPSPTFAAQRGATPEIAEEIAKLNDALQMLSPDSLRGQGKLYEPGGGGLSKNYWLIVIWAIASLKWSSGKEIARRWSQGSQRYEDEGFEEAWSAYDPERANPIGIGSLYKLAKDFGWQSLQPSSSYAPPIAANAARYKVMSSSDLNAQPDLTWRVKRVLPASGLAALFGPSGSGKSFLALSLAAAIAHGRPWFGYRVIQAPVVYVMLEGEGGIKNRVAALEKAEGKLPDDSFGVIAQQFHLTSSQDVNDLAAVIAQGAVVFIDTLNRAAPSSDENSSKDMGEIIAAAKALQASVGGLVVVVHHTGKDASKGMRGHSSLHAALDAAIEVTKTTTGTRHWSNAKVKDGEDGKQVAFRLKLHVLGKDADGDDVTSCSVEPDQSGLFIKAEPKGAKQRQALKVLRGALSVGRMTVEDAVRAVSVTLAATPSNKRSNEARRLIQALIHSGHLGSELDGDEGWCWLI